MDGGIAPVEVLVFSKYCVYSLFLGIFVYRLVTSRETRNVPSGRVVLSMKFTKSVVSSRCDFCDLAID